MVDARPIPGFPGYAATSDGIILSYWRLTYRGRHGSVSSIGEIGLPIQDFDRKLIGGKLSGYRSVAIKHADGRRRNRYVHELVLFAFAGPRPSPEHEALHGNADRADNRKDNLKWGTVQENADDRERHGHVLRGDDWYRARGLPPPSMRNGSSSWEPPPIDESRGPFDDLLDEAREAIA